MTMLFARNVISNRRRRRPRCSPAAARSLAHPPSFDAAALVNINSGFSRGLRLTAQNKYTQTSARKLQNVLAPHPRQMGTKDLE